MTLVSVTPRDHPHIEHKTRYSSSYLLKLDSLRSVAGAMGKHLSLKNTEALFNHASEINWPMAFECAIIVGKEMSFTPFFL